MKIAKKKSWPKWPVFNKEDRLAVNRVIKSNNLVAWGNDKKLFPGEVKEFEKEFKKYIGAKYALGVGNATQGLHLAVTALNIGVGDEVIVSVYSFISTASCVLMQNAVPIFADIDETTLLISASEAEKKITKRTKAIIVTTLFGYPSDLSSLISISRKYNIPIIEDASHSHGASINGKKIGSFGLISVFSLNQRKVLPAGDGGIVLTNNRTIAKKIYRLRSFGEKELSYNYRLSEFAAAIVRGRLKKLDFDNALRHKNALFLDKLFKGFNYIKVRLPNKNSISSYYKLILECNFSTKKITINKFVKLMNKRGIPISKTYTPLHLHPHFNSKIEPARGYPWNWKIYSNKRKRHISYKNEKYPVAERLINKELLQLNIHPPVSQNEMKKVYNTIISIFKKINM